MSVHMRSRNTDTSVAVLTPMQMPESHELYATSAKKGGPERAANQERSEIRR